MIQDVKKYIDSEFEVSKLRVESLTKSNNLSEVTVGRLVELEKFFQSIDFESLKINTVSDAMTAVRLFRSSKKDFIKLYLKKNDYSDFKVFDSILNYRERLFDGLMEEKGLSCIATKDALKRFILANSSLKLYKALDSKLKMLKVDDSTDRMYIEFINQHPNEIFGFYEDSRSEVIEELTSHKKLKYKINGLTDIISLNPNASFSFQKIISHGKVSKGIVLPIRHLGRETTWVCFKKIIINEIDFSEIFSYSLKNVLHEGRYYKAIILRDKKEIIEEESLLSQYHALSNLFYQNALDNLSSQKSGISIDLQKSKIYIPSSRTEDDSLRENWQNFLLDFKQIINGVKDE